MAEHNDDIVRFRKPGKALTTEEKWMVLHVLQRCKEARRHPECLPSGDSYQEASYYTGVSKKVVVEIARYFKEQGTVPRPAKPGNSVNHQALIDPATTALIRQYLLHCQRDGTPCQAPQIQSLVREHRRLTIHVRTIQRHVARLGFEYRQTTEGSRTLCEHPMVRQQRRAYLRQLQELRQAGYQTVYVDEFFCETSPDRQRPVWGLRHALTEQGFLPDCERLLERKNSKGGSQRLCNFAEFYHWFTTILCRKAPPPTCIVLDRASYHFLPEENLIPERLSRQEMQSWLTEHTIPWQEHWSKAHLIQAMHSQLEAMLLIRRVAETHGHRLLLLPPAHPELNPFELAWTTIMTACREAPPTLLTDGKNADVQSLLATVTPHLCPPIFHQVYQFEDAYRALDFEKA